MNSYIALATKFVASLLAAGHIVFSFFGQLPSKILPPIQKPLAGKEISHGEVLAALTFSYDNAFFNIPVEFKEAVTGDADLTISGASLFKKNITAPNVIYGALAGQGIAVGAGQTPTITNTGVLALGGQSGSIDLSAGSGISVSGLSISNSGVTSLQGSSGALSLTAGTGISISGLTLSNSDLGSAQNIFKTFAVSGQSNIVASSNTDSITFAGGTGVTLTTDSTNKKLTITANSSSLNVSGWTDDGTVVRLTDITDSVGIGTTTPTSKLHVTGAVTGKALSIFDETGDQSPLTASESGKPVFTVAHPTGTIVNGLTLTPSISGSGVAFASSGDDTNIALTLNGKGTGGLNLNTTNTGNVTIGNSTGTFALTSSGGLNVTTGGALTGVASVDTITHSATALTFTSTAPTISVSTAATGISLEAGTSGAITIGGTSTGGVNIAGSGTGDVNIAGGSGSTGCTVTNSNGNLACSGTITSGGTAAVVGSGTLNRLAKFTATGSTIGDSSITDTGSAVTLASNVTLATAGSSGTITSAGTLTASNGLTLTTGALSLTSTSGAVALTLSSSTTAFNVQSGLFDIDTTNSNVGIGTTAPGEKLEVVGNIISKGTSWTIRTSAADNNWQSVTYGNGLFVAVAQNGSGNRVMSSPDGITWTSRTSAANNQWQSVTYGNGLFVAVSSTGTGNRVMSSPDGITWTSRTSAADNNWNAVTYGNGLFVAVSDTGTGNRVMSSPDGITWTSRTSAADNSWTSVTYGNSLFVAVSSDGSGNRVMSSPDGITWTIRTSAANNQWQSVTYGNGLFVAVSISGTGNRVMTSPDGITWTSRTSAADNDWRGVTYGNGLFVAVSSTGTGNRVMTSPDGITWTSRTSAADNDWRGVTYGNGLFVAVSSTGTGNRVMSSGKTDYIPFSANNIYQGGLTSTGTLTASNGLTLTTGALSLTSTSGTAALTLTSSTTAFNVQSGVFDIDTTNSRVGIGTTSPLEKLDVNGNATASGNLTLVGAARTIAGRAMNSLTLGDSQTGNLLLSPGSNAIVLGTGENGTPVATTLRGTAGAGTNVAGATLTVDASDGTGNAGSGNITFRTAPSRPTITPDGTNDSSGNSGSAGTNTLSFSHTTGSGTDRILVVGVSFKNGTSQTVTGITYATKAFTNLTTATNGTTVRSEMWYLVGPPMGTATITVTTTGGNLRFAAGAASFFGVNQTTPFGTAVTNTGTTTTATVDVTSATDELVIDSVAKDNSTEAITPSGSQAQRWNDTTTSTASNNARAGGSTLTGAATTTMAWTWPTTARAWATIGAPLKPVGSASSSTANTLSDVLFVSNKQLVGIGTTSPLEKLDVAGNILLQGGGYLDTRAAGTLGIGLGQQTALTLGRTGATTTVTGSTVTVNGNITFNNTVQAFTLGGNITGSGTPNMSGMGSFTGGAISGTTITASGVISGNGGFAITGAGNVDILVGGPTDSGSVSIGNGIGTFRLTSNGGLNVTTVGALTGVASLDTITTSGTALTFTSTAPTISVSTAATGISLEGGTSGVITIGGTSTGGVNIAGSGTGDVNLAGGSGSTGCTVTNSTGALTCTGTVTASNGLTLTTGALSLTATSGSAALTLTSSTTAFNVQAGLFDIDTTNSRVGIGTAAPSRKLDVAGAVEVDLPGTTTSFALCHTTQTGTTNEEIVDCTGTPIGDFAESYPTEKSVDYGEIVMVGTEDVTLKDGKHVRELVRANSPYTKQMIGITSNNYQDFISIGQNVNQADHPMPVALNGRVPVKISSSSPPIKAGDYLTSSYEEGRAMKAEKAGEMIGKALEDWDPSSGKDTIMVFVNLRYGDPDDILASLSLNADGSLVLPQNTKLAQVDNNNSQTPSPTQISDLNTRLKNLENSASSEAQMKDRLDHLSQDLDFLKGQVLGASVSAALQNSKSILSDGQTATLSALTVTGNTNLYDLGVVGNFNVGTVNIDGLSGSLNSIGQDLKIQSNKIAGVSFEGGAITIDTSGNISLKEGRIIGNDNIRGINVSVTSGHSQIQITFKNSRPNSSYAVSVSPSWLTQFAVTNKTANGFTIEFSQAPSADSSLDWLVID